MADSIAQPAPTSKDMIESSLELAAGIAELDNLIERHVEEFRRVKAQRDVLLAAVKRLLALAAESAEIEDSDAHYSALQRLAVDKQALNAIATAEGR